MRTLKKRAFHYQRITSPDECDGKITGSQKVKKPATIVFILFAFLSSSSVFADDYDDGMAALHKKDYKTAIAKFRAAAEQGKALSEYHLGVMYLKGYGVPKNNAEAFKLFRRAAEQNYAPAQFEAGFMHSKGNGTPKDYIEAYKWLYIAAANGNEDGKKNLDIIVKSMASEQISKARQSATEWMSAQKDRLLN